MEAPIGLAATFWHCMKWKWPEQNLTKLPICTHYEAQPPLPSQCLSLSPALTLLVLWVDASLLLHETCFISRMQVMFPTLIHISGLCLRWVFVCGQCGGSGAYESGCDLWRIGSEGTRESREGPWESHSEPGHTQSSLRTLVSILSSIVTSKLASFVLCFFKKIRCCVVLYGSLLVGQWQDGQKLFHFWPHFTRKVYMHVCVST